MKSPTGSVPFDVSVTGGSTSNFTYAGAVPVSPSGTQTRPIGLLYLSGITLLPTGYDAARCMNVL